MRREGGGVGQALVRSAMVKDPLVCGPDTDLDEVRRMMLERHARYMPVLQDGHILGVISFYDVAKAVVDSQNFENKMLKAYIRDWPWGLSPTGAQIELKTHSAQTPLDLPIGLDLTLGGGASQPS